MSKNTRNRILLTALAALLLVAVAVGGTMAWLVDKTENVVNTFTTSNVDIDLDEDTNDLEMVPGSNVSKAPYVTVHKDSENCWVFVKITKNSNYDTYLGAYTVDSNTWSKLDNSGVDGNSAVYYTKVDSVAEKAVPLYILAGGANGGTIKVNESVTNQQMVAAESNPPTLSFIAYACQLESVDDVAKAWEYAQGAEEFAISNGTTASNAE